VRRLVGYRRFWRPGRGSRARVSMRRRGCVNFFQPSLKLSEESREPRRAAKHPLWRHPRAGPAGPVRKVHMDPRSEMGWQEGHSLFRMAKIVVPPCGA
jgi:hypothetical protein